MTIDVADYDTRHVVPVLRRVAAETARETGTPRLAVDLAVVFGSFGAGEAEPGVSDMDVLVGVSPGDWSSIHAYRDALSADAVHEAVLEPFAGAVDGFHVEVRPTDRVRPLCEDRCARGDYDRVYRLRTGEPCPPSAIPETGPPGWQSTLDDVAE